MLLQHGRPSGATLLIWEHTLDSNGKPCSNPRAIVPRWDVPNIVKEPVEVDVRSFGVRMPPPPAITRTTASWVCCISFRRHWLGCGA